MPLPGPPEEKEPPPPIKYISTVIMHAAFTSSHPPYQINCLCIARNALVTPPHRMPAQDGTVDPPQVS